MTPKPSSISEVWADQADFNRLFRQQPATFEEQSNVTREMVLHLIAQATQLLECTDWRTHRNRQVKQNRAQIGSQLTDIHKYWITLCQVWGFGHDDMMDLYWKKSMVCRQRYAEEWVRSIQHETVILDLDNVLCDYTGGFGQWLIRNALLAPEEYGNIVQLIERRQWLNSTSSGIDHTYYQELKHRFRTCGAKTVLPVMPGAVEFVQWCRAQGWQIVILTSRPIDEYPNLYSDTLLWLDRNNMSPDFVWWGADKGEKLLDKKVLPYIRFVVDDDEQFAYQYAHLGVRTYWLNPNIAESGEDLDTPEIYITQTLKRIVEVENVRRQGASPAR